MSRSLEYIFPAGNEQDICLLQDTDGGGDNLKLNGFLVNATGAEVSFIERGYSRTVSLTSVNNLAGVQFFVRGIQNGVELEEVISGPNDNSVYTVQSFDKITSIFVGPVVRGISVGTGIDGFFPLIEIDLERPMINYGLSIALLSTSTIQTAIYASLNDINENGVTYLDTVNNSNMLELKALSTEGIYLLPPEDIGIYKSLLIGISYFAGTDIDHAIRMNFIQI